MDSSLIDSFKNILIETVNQPPKTLLIIILIAAFGLQFYLKKESDTKNLEKIRLLEDRIDTLMVHSATRDLFWLSKIDSIKSIYTEEIKLRNKELEDLNQMQNQTNRMVENAIINIRKSR